MRVAHRRGVVEGVVVGAAIAGSRRPPAVVVPAPAYYGAGAPVAAAAATGAVYGAAAATAARPPNDMYYNTGAYPPPNPGYYPPPPIQPAMAPYPAPPPMVAPAALPPYMPPPAVAPTVIVEPAAPAAAVVAAGAAVKAAEAAAVVKAFEKRPCFIVNEANNSLLEVRRGNVKPGAEVVLERRHKDRPRHQQWYLDENGIIRSCLNEFAIESKANGEHLRMMPFTGDARQKWTVQHNKIVNAVFCNDCIGLKKGLIRVKDDADVISCLYEGKPYQHWRIEFL